MSVRTVNHGRHFTNLPGGEITIEGTRCTAEMEKHCTTPATKRSSMIKMGLKKKERIVQI